MSRYRRTQVPGGTYFFTVNLRNRRSDLLVRRVGLLRETVRAKGLPLSATMLGPSYLTTCMRLEASG